MAAASLDINQAATEKQYEEEGLPLKNSCPDTLISHVVMEIITFLLFIV